VQRLGYSSIMQYALSTVPLDITPIHRTIVLILARVERSDKTQRLCAKELVLQAMLTMGNAWLNVLMENLDKILSVKILVLVEERHPQPIIFV
jgi:hypothetical protein